ncbi:MAG: aldose epimerase [Jaaginema sp. PMC 1079.18]|nr:aldose epimerase [Jaaginema sp. PMC 1080.18]MEC4851064.1 aldose epimerase [Jaaginema sp. PMC 1079.18]MEC4866980.1 aldose epimerase [Jaaginema sp. PMC 1078.18]
MFAISIKQEQYQTYILADQKAHSRIEVVPERGGIITNWRIQGQNILYLDEERFTDPSLSIRGGIPILFPICGNLPGNIFYQGDREYTLKQHGFARDLPWQVVDSHTDGLACLKLRLESNAKTLAIYPFEFQLNFTYELQGNNLTLRQEYINKSETVMPFSTGLHPYFWVTDKTQLEFKIPASHRQDQNTQEIHPFDGTFDFNQDEIDVALRPVTQNQASMSNHRRNFKITLDYSDRYSTLVFWAVQGKDYVCLEPWSAPRNALNTGENLSYLEPGQSQETLVTFSLSYL